MNTVDTPIVGGPGDFWTVIGIMLLCSGTIGAFVFRKRWL
jgi:Mg2+ and Co2+ transporter CorA